MKITRTLKVGVSGNDVKFLQESLNSIGNYGLNVTGTFDSSTVSVVKAFQENNGLTADGIVGQMTLKSISSKAIFTYASNFRNCSIIRRSKRNFW